MNERMSDNRKLDKNRKRSRKRIDALEISKKSRKKGKGEGKASQV